MKNRITQILISIAIIILFGTGLFFTGYKIGQKTFSTINNFDTVMVKYDTIKVAQFIEKPVPYNVIDTILIPLQVDTAAIIKDYYKERQYLFTYPFGTVSFNVFNNSLFDYAANFNVINKTVYLRPKYIWGIGGNIGMFQNKMYIEASGFYSFKNNTFQLGVSYPLGIRVGYYYTFFKFQCKMGKTYKDRNVSDFDKKKIEKINKERKLKNKKRWQQD